MSGSRLILDDSFCGNSFIERRELHDFSSSSVFIDNTVFFSDFPVIISSLDLITNGISIILKYDFVSLNE